MQEELVWDLCVRKILKESLVLIDCHIAFISVPESAKLIDYLPIKFDRVRNELGELFYGFLD